MLTPLSSAHSQLTDARLVLLSFRKESPIFSRVKLRIDLPSGAAPGALVEVAKNNSERKQDTEYFGEIAAQMDNGGLAAMLYDLERWDISDIDLRRAPQTEALTRQKLLSLDPRERWLFDKFCEGRILPDDSGWSPEVEKSKLHRDYVEELQKSGSRGTGTQTELGMFLKSTLGSALSETRPKRGSERVRCWVFPPLQQCRDVFDRKLGTSYDWPAADLEAVPRSKVLNLRTIGKTA